MDFENPYQVGDIILFERHRPKKEKTVFMGMTLQGYEKYPSWAVVKKVIPFKIVVDLGGGDEDEIPLKSNRGRSYLEHPEQFILERTGNPDWKEVVNECERRWGKAGEVNLDEWEKQRHLDLLKKNDSAKAISEEDDDDEEDYDDWELYY